MTKRVELVFDFVSPNAYMVWGPLKEIAARRGAELAVIPVFLAGMHRITGNAPPMIRDAEVKGKNAYAQLEMDRYIAKHGLTKYRLHPQFPFNSITLQRMLQAACNDGRGVEFVEALLAPIWEEGLDIASPQAIGSVLAAAGFDAAELFARAQSDDVKQALAANTDAVVERGAFGIPTMWVGNEMFFGKERLGQVEEELAKD
ncbi:2-hydroxychromene-2-carboxylate isomerase [Erythrobacter sp. sf7]|uniref:2-hydroxychromene-2-carboxylate isomerase n=1 Tax=Erythrobacter fulvus TaxID=2987523 RepID=A0ABT5JQ77_9SPHN|nr:2-hydroxychromene-2-carboxylate isomerase [Erythrobacter fulvus]MDC8754679.1 2-hydroxychromene-2-carboxylate isomerase [Erythrobacter fulvus]